MTFYEELGLTAAASVPEIMHSYKNLCKILHPDRHQQAALKKVAECQMRRIHQMIEVLSDQERRREYDRSIGMKSAASPVHARSPQDQVSAKPSAEPNSTRSVWLVAALAGMLFIYVLVREDVHSAGTSAAQDPGPAAVPRTDNREITQLHKSVEDLQRRLSAIEHRQQRLAKP
jgi:curved DNA-binding protein CbpA